jgi:mono/diheme cytochrome c family protein
MRLLLLPVCILLFTSCNSDAPEDRKPEAAETVSDAVHGKLIFQQYCASCHMMDQDVTGPKLRGAVERWNNDTVRMKAFIRNSAALIADGDPLALQAKQRGRGGAMPAFPSLTDEDLQSLIAYIQAGD